MSPNLQKKHPRLKRSFFARPTLVVAQELLGKALYFNNFCGLITETEAYIGEEDPACHAARGKTPRTEVMYDKAGLSYIFLIYGMYHCLNFVTERKNEPAAVLIRGLYLLNPLIHLDGPGKLCKKIGLDRSHNKIDIAHHEKFFLQNCGLSIKYKTTERIGISKGQDRLWRFVCDEPHLSEKVLKHLS